LKEAMMKSQLQKTGIAPPLNTWLAIIPILAGMCSIVVAVRGSSAPSLRWSGISITQPVDGARVYEDRGEVLFESGQAQAVRAAIGGTVTAASERRLEITEGPLVLRYRGLFSNEKIGSRVHRGGIVGRLELGRPDPAIAKLWMQLLDNGTPVLPHLTARFPTEGQRIYSMSCAGCHQMRGVAAVENGKLWSGRPATEETVEREIREGGHFNTARNLPPMPKFQDVLSDPEIKAVTAYLCRNECSGSK
jgi:hypothetical protein